MPVQLTLRSPKGGRVLAEREYADGYRIDAVSGWLVVVDRNGSVIAAHAACPGLEGAVVEHASAAAPPLRVADVRDDDRFAERLLDHLGRLGDEYGPLGVAIAAATLTDPQVLVRQIVDEHGGAEVLQGVRLPEEGDGEPDAEDPVDHTHDGCEANLDALRAEVARLSGLLDDASREADRADRAEVSEGAWRREVEEQTRRAEREHATRLALAEQLAEERATVALYRHRYGPVIAEAGGGRSETNPHPIAEDPRRPSLDHFPDDAILLTYREVRQLLALHLEACSDSPHLARAMREGESGLRLAEVLDR
jgi:hypothetical protein